MSDSNVKDKLSELLNIGEASDENITALINELKNAQDIETKTNVSRGDIMRITKAISYARRYGVDVLDVYTRDILLRLLVSIDRGGRKDIVEALSAVFRFNLEKSSGQNVKV